MPRARSSSQKNFSANIGFAAKNNIGGFDFVHLGGTSVVLGNGSVSPNQFGEGDMRVAERSKPLSN